MELIPASAPKQPTIQRVLQHSYFTPGQQQLWDWPTHTPVSEIHRWRVSSKNKFQKPFVIWLPIVLLSLSIRWRGPESSYCSLPVPQQSFPGCSATHGWRDASRKDPGHCVWWYHFHWMWPVLCWARHRWERHLQTVLPMSASYWSTTLLQVTLSNSLMSGSVWLFMDLVCLCAHVLVF